MLTEGFEGVAPHKGRTARQHLEERTAEGINIRAFINLTTFNLLRAHIEGSAKNCTGSSLTLRDAITGGEPGDAEIHQLEHGDGILRITYNHEVAGLDITVHDTMLMGARKGISQADKELESQVHRQILFLPQQDIETFSREQLHNQIGTKTLINTHVMYADNAIVVEPGQRLGFGLKAQPVFVGKLLTGKNLEGIGFTKNQVLATKDHSHTASTKKLEELVRVVNHIARQILPHGTGSSGDYAGFTGAGPHGFLTGEIRIVIEG